MVCTCGHNKINHENGRDYKPHEYKCRGDISKDGKRIRPCDKSCEYYKKQMKVS